MPELPEVETWRRLADRASTGKTIAKAVAQADTKIFDRNDPETLASELTGRPVFSTCRAGKHMWLHLQPRQDLYIHFGMTGSLHWLQPEEPAPSHVKLELILEDGSRLLYRNLRRIGKIRLLDDARVIPPVSTLGPDPIKDGLPLKDLTHTLSQRKAPIKAVLLDQTVFAGVGNWIADEVLYQARLDPRLPCNRLQPKQVQTLRTCLLRILRKAIEVDADSSRFPETWLFHHRWGKKAQQTPTGERIQFDQIGGRTTAWVPERLGERSVIS
jgi:formamidopyrimidine-DNA glycosylase